MFWGKYYREFNLDTLKSERKPLEIVDNWPGLSGTEFEKGINSAISDNKRNMIYLIKGPDVVGCDVSSKKCGKINKISEQWPALSDSEFGNYIDAAANIPNTNESYLFLGGYYLKFNLDTLKPEGKPLTIYNNWPGLSGKEFANKVTAALTDKTHDTILLYSAKNIPGDIPGGGWEGCTSGCGTIGMAWANKDGQLIGHVTVDHLGNGVGSIINSIS